MQALRTFRNNAWILLFATVAGCATPPVDPDGDGSGGDGKGDNFGTTDGSPTWFTFPWLWANESATEATLPSGTLDHDAAIVKRLQFWVDAVDAKLRERYPKAMTNTPKPSIYVTTRRDPILGALNAAVHATRECLAAPVTMEAPGAQDVPILAFFPNGAVGKVNTCLTREVADASRATIVSFYNQGSEFCKVADRDGGLVLGKDCAFDFEFTGGPKSGMSAAFGATSSWIEVQKGLIQSTASEQSLLFVLFHELGHYYRGHLSTPSDRLNYFYRLDTAEAGRKPAADPELSELTDAVRRKMQHNAVSKLKATFTAENQRVVSERLGFYTVEEEADKYALELLAMMGMDPMLSEETILALGRQWEVERGGPAPGEISADACKALADRGWMDEQGNEAVVPLGNLGDLHHSPCFRAFNMDREIKSGFTIDSSTDLTPPGGDWATLHTAF